MCFQALEAQLSEEEAGRQLLLQEKEAVEGRARRLEEEVHLMEDQHIKLHKVCACWCVCVCVCVCVSD